MRRKIGKKYPYFLIGIIAVVAISTILFMAANNSNINNENENVCPDGGDWVKVEGIAPSYTAPGGEIIEAVCVKGGNEPSQNEYLHTFTEDGWYTVEGENCVGVSGIGTGSASAYHGPADENICAEISHASFLVKDAPTATEETPTLTPTSTEEEKEEPTPTMTNTLTFTPTATEETPTPTPTSTDEEKEEPTPTMTNTLTFTPTATEETPTLTPTSTEEEKEEPTPTMTPIDEEKDDPTPTPTEEPKEEDTPTPAPTDTSPDVDAGGSGPSMGSIMTLFGISGLGLGMVIYLISKLKKHDNV